MSEKFMDRIFRKGKDGLFYGEDIIREDSGENTSHGMEKGKDRLDRYKIIIDDIIGNALSEKSSDIHMEPMKNRTRVRYRVDGDLIEYDSIDPDDYNGIKRIIKLDSGCDITESKRPQDGRFSFRYNKDSIDIRSSIIPAVYGEKVVLRLLNRSDFLKRKSQLGFSREAEKKIERITGRKSGMLIVSGPTGSGKSTTVYSILNELSEKNINIVTIEDPVEYKIQGINQMQVDEKAGVNFSNGLRSILRQDPDCIVVGEIRDRETADIAMRAAVTGHLVITTLHTTDALSTIIRLADMGIEPYIINAALNGVISQKLIKKSDITGEESGRALVYEILDVDDELRSLVKDRRPMSELKKAAVDGGMITFEDSLERIRGESFERKNKK